MSGANERPSSIPEHAERVDAGGGDHGSDNGIGDSISAEDRANLAAMERGEPLPEPGDQGGQDRDQGDQGGDDAGDDADGDGDDQGDGGQQQQKAPAAKDGQQKPGDQTQPKDGKQPQAKPGDGDGQQQDKPKGRTVNREKYERDVLREKTARETAEAALRNAEITQAKLGERMALLNEAIQTINKGGEAKPGADGQQQAAPAAQRGAIPPRAADPEPDADADPFGHSQWTRRELARTQADFADLSKRIDDRNTQQDQSAAHNDLVGSYQREMQTAFQADPVNAQAYDFMRNSRYQELGFTFAGVDIFDDVEVAKLTPKQQGELSDKISKTFHGEELWLAEQARTGGPSVATRIRQLAQSRGFKPQAAQQRNPDSDGADGGQQQNRGGNGERRQVAQRDGQQQDGRERMRNLRSNIEDSRSLSDGHSAGDSGLSLERLANMDDAEFMDALSDMSPQKLNKLLGA